MLRKLEKFYLNTDFIESIHPIGEGPDMKYVIHTVSGKEHTVTKKIGDSILLEFKAKDAKKASSEKALPKKTAKDLKEVLEMAKKVNNPFGR